jgi:RNA polymerase sigma factor (sigma-70 family)
MEMTDDRGRGLRTWVERYRPVGERFFRRRGCSHDLVADLTQETLLLIWKNRDSFRGDNEATFRSWAGCIARTVWARHWVDDGRRPTMEPLEDEPTGPAADPAASAAEGQEHAILQSAIGRLPPKMRCVLTLVSQGRTENEVAIILRCSLNTVKAHMHQARARLRQDLGGRG